MKGARTLAGAAFVLAAVTAAPAASIAQDDGTAGVAPAAPTTPTAPALPATPNKDAKGSESGPSDSGPSAVASEASSPPPTSRSAIAHASASATVTMGDNFFSPNSVTIAVGDTVTWRNNGQAIHNATANDGSFNTGNLNPGGSGSHTFSSSGTFDYVCTIHPGMNGTVRVLASSSGGGGGGGSTSSGSAPSEASAVTSPDAAGTSTTLPATGLAVGALAMIGLTLFTTGMIIRWLDPDRRGLRFLTIF